MKVLKITILCLVALTATSVFAQDKPTDTNMQILLDKVKADKKLVVAANMDLTEPEAKAFWPMYDDYQKELVLTIVSAKRFLLADAQQQDTD